MELLLGCPQTQVLSLGLLGFASMGVEAYGVTKLSLVPVIKFCAPYFIWFCRACRYGEQ